MIASPQKKGPASVAADPDRGSNNPLKGKPMNTATNSTKPAAPATVPYPAHSPIDEMDRAISALRTIRVAVMADSLGLADYSMADAECMLHDAMDQLDPIRAFLAENEFRDIEKPFLECRREWFARKGGVE